MFEDFQYAMKDRKRNPRDGAGILSILTFFFTLGLVRKGYDEELKEKDVYQIMRRHDSSRLTNNLEKRWTEEQSKDKPSLFRALKNTFGKEFLIFGIIQVILKTSTTIIRQIALQQILSMYGANAKHSDKSTAKYYGLAFILCTFILTTYTQVYLMCMQEIALKIRVSLSSLIYRKCLRLRSATVSEFTIGNTVTLVSKDIREFENFVIALQDSICGVIQVVANVYLMYVYVGVSSLIGTSFLLLVFPIQLCLSRCTTLKRLRTAAQTDRRLRIIQEVLSSIRIIKMYTWENYFAKIVNACRRTEILNLRIVFYLKSFIAHIGVIAVRLGLFAAIFYYTHFTEFVVSRNIYLIMSCMHTIRMVTVTDFPKLLASSAEIVSSLKRIQRLLTSDEANMDMDSKNIITNNPSIRLNATIGLRDNPSFLTANLKIEKGLIGLSGPLGSGTTLFLKTLLGDLPYKGEIEINGVLSYASQEPWLFPGSIKQNIIFGKRFVKDRYNKILRVCALEKDMANFPKGDETIINDDGICLSRGQQGRINLARALYKEADIYLLDNCLSSLDTKIKNHIFENCMKSYLKDKLCIFSTNRDTYLTQADTILTIRNNQVETLDNHENIKNIPLDLLDEVEEQYSGIIYKSGYVEPDENTKLIDATEHMYHEDVKIGKVNFSVYREYLRRAGYFYIALLIALFIGWQFFSSNFERFIRDWSNIEDKYAFLKRNDTINATIIEALVARRSKIPVRFGIVMTGITVLYLLETYLFFYLTAKTSKTLHKLTFMNIIHAPISFFDEHLAGNIMNRFSKDVAAVDEYIPLIVQVLLQQVFLSFGCLWLIGRESLGLLGLSFSIIIVVWVVRSLYMPTCRSLKRLEAATRSPVIGLLRTSLDGVNTLRTSGLHQQLKDEFDKNQNLHTTCDFMYLTVNRALCYCVECFLCVYLGGVIIYCLFVLESASTGGVGLILTQSYALTKFLPTVVRTFSELENQMTSVERVLEYRDIRTEPKSGSDHKDWPKDGKIEYDSVSLRYPKTNQLVLKEISFTITPKERVCIIGRTGAGKTSMLSTLFRLYEKESGSILLDDQETSNVSLKTLRSGLSIIPQNPMLFTGTLRSNLDPNSKYTDPDLWKALNEVNFQQFCQEEVTLDTSINEGQISFSPGQKQLICLARALLTKNRVLILDEATSYLDNETSDAIERLIKTKFSDCTLITILHRLKTVLNYDKVMILSDGKIVEYDNPQNLLNDQSSVFYNIISKEK